MDVVGPPERPGPGEPSGLSAVGAEPQLLGRVVGLSAGKVVPTPSEGNVAGPEAVRLGRAVLASPRVADPELSVVTAVGSEPGLLCNAVDPADGTVVA